MPTRLSLFERLAFLGLCALFIALSMAGCLREAHAEPLDAVVRVRETVIGPEGGYYAGSGTVIDEAGYVLTCHHVLEHALARGSDRAIVTWRSGFETPMRVVASDAKWDICLLAPLQKIVCRDFYRVAGDGEWPKQGETVELVGYGGGQFRHWTAPVQGFAALTGSPYYDQISVATQSISGDSGGAILFKGKLVGVLWGGPLASEHGPMTATQGTCSETLRPWIARCQGYFFGGGGCGPCNACPPCNGGGVCPLPPSAYMPQPRQPLRPTQKPQPRQPVAPQTTLIAGPPGPPGKDGRDGQDGASCDTPAVIAALEQKLPTAEAVADALFAKYGDELRGPAGKDGTDGRDGAAGKSATLPNLDAAIAEKIRDKLRIEVQHE